MPALDEQADRRAEAPVDFVSAHLRKEPRQRDAGDVVDVDAPAVAVERPGDGRSVPCLRRKLPEGVWEEADVVRDVCDAVLGDVCIERWTGGDKRLQAAPELLGRTDAASSTMTSAVVWRRRSASEVPDAEDNHVCPGVWRGVSVVLMRSERVH